MTVSTSSLRAHDVDFDAFCRVTCSTNRDFEDVPSNRSTSDSLFPKGRGHCTSECDLPRFGPFTLARHVLLIVGRRPHSPAKVPSLPNLHLRRLPDEIQPTHQGKPAKSTLTVGPVESFSHFTRHVESDSLMHIAWKIQSERCLSLALHSYRNGSAMPPR